MITCDKNGAIVVSVDNKSYNLSLSEEYVEFLMWATSPDAAASVSDDEFSVNTDLSDQEKAKAERYSAFLKNYAKRRAERLKAEATTLTADQRDVLIKDLISKLSTEH